MLLRGFGGLLRGFGGLLRSQYIYEGYETNWNRRKCNDGGTHPLSSLDHVLFTKQEDNKVLFITNAESPLTTNNPV